MIQHYTLIGRPSFLDALPIVVEHALTVSSRPRCKLTRCIVIAKASLTGHRCRGYKRSWLQEAAGMAWVHHACRCCISHPILPFHIWLGCCKDHLHCMSSHLERLIQARLSKELLIGVALGFSLCLSSTSLWLYVGRSRQKSRPPVDFDDSTPIEIAKNEVAQGVPGLVGK